MRKAVIVSAVRTPVGNYGGSLKDISARELGALAIKEALKRSNIEGKEVDEVIFGCVLQGGLGQNISRQCALDAGIPNEVPTITINKVCGSGLRSVSLAAQTIIAGDNDVVVVGGTESMSKAEYFLENARWGYRMGNGEFKDSMINDGLWDAFNNYHMGITAENLAEQYDISREEQDSFAVASQNKAEKAQIDGKFDEEIVPVIIPQRKKDPIVFDKDEFIKYGATLENLQKLRPAFKKDGTVTAANASGINDGAAALVIMSEEKCKELGLEPLAKIVSYACAGVEPSIMGIGPVDAVKKALKKGNLNLEDMDLIEANEAFAAQSLAVAKELDMDMNKVNVNGGAIAIGHPIGASGARIFVTLLHEMKRRDSKYGLATLCIGGGMGTAVVVER